ncbi:unnamed protein product [Agarophyton chilense]
MKEQYADQGEVMAAARVTVNFAPERETRVPVWIRAVVSTAIFAHRSPLSKKIKLQTPGVGNENRIESEPPRREIKLSIAYESGRLRMCLVSIRFKVHLSSMVSPTFLRAAYLRSISAIASDKIGCLFSVKVEHAWPSEVERVEFDITKLIVTSKHG